MLLQKTTPIEFLSGKSSIYYSPAAFTNDELLAKTMAHETAHAYGNTLGQFSLLTRQERQSIRTIDPRLDYIEHVAIKKLEWNLVLKNNFNLSPSLNLASSLSIIKVSSFFDVFQRNLYNKIINSYRPIFDRIIKF